MPLFVVPMAPLAVAAALALTIAQPSNAATSPRHRNVMVSVEHTKVDSGDWVRLHATAPGSPTGAMVEFDRRVGHAWKRVALRRTVSRRGTVSAKVAAPTKGSAVYRARALRTRKLAPANSRNIRITVVQPAAATLRASTANVDSAGQTITLRGASSPFRSGTLVRLERDSWGSWRQVTTTRMSHRGAYSFSVQPSPGLHSYRVRVAPVTNHSSGQISGAVSNEVHVSAPRAVASVSVGEHYACSTSPGGVASCWGQNQYGQLGIGSTTDTSRTTKVAGGRTWQTISAGRTITCGIAADGTLWCWGEGFNVVPAEVGDGTHDWKLVTAGDSHACAVKTDGTAWCGGGAYGHLAQVGTDSDWSAIDAGIGQTCGIRDATAPVDPESEEPTNYDETLWCWGADRQAVQVGSGREWRSISVGAAYQCGTQENGTLWCWGANDYGQLGNGTLAESSHPMRVGGRADWQSVSAGSVHTCGTRGSGTDDTLWCWGGSGAGETGTAGAGDDLAVLKPTLVRKGLQWQSVSAGVQSTCAIEVDNGISCWGATAHGQLGSYGWTFPES